MNNMDNMKSIAFIVAMEKEFNQLRTILSDIEEETHDNVSYSIGVLNNYKIILCHSGIGKVNAAIAAMRLMMHYQPHLVVSTGVAGGADCSMNVMDVVVGSEYVYHDMYCGKACAPGQVLGMPPRFSAPNAIIQKALSVSHPDGNIHAGLIVTGDWFVDDKNKMQTIVNDFPEAKAVDMESCAIAQTCYIYNTPFVSFRIISDIPLNDTDASQYFDFWERLASGSFAVVRDFVHKLTD